MDMHFDTRAETNPFDGFAPSGLYFAPALEARAVLATDPVSEPAPALSEAACPDVPPAVGHMIVASYAALLGAFGLVFLSSADVLFMIGVCAVYLAVYLGVPWVMLRVEAQHRPHAERGFSDFLETGISTWTGRVSGTAALVQILTIPLALTLAVCGLGVILRLSA